MTWSQKYPFSWAETIHKQSAYCTYNLFLSRYDSSCIHLLMHQCFLGSLGVLGLTTETLVQPRPVFKWHSTDPTGQAFSAASTLLFMALLLIGPRDPQSPAGIAEGMACKPPTAHLHWHAPGPPPVPAAVLRRHLVRRPLPLISKICYNPCSHSS